MGPVFYGRKLKVMDIALITGGATGLGLEIAKLFLQDNIPVLIVSRDSKRLKYIREKLKSFYKSEIFILAKDLTFENSYKEIYDYTKKNKLKVKYLINNAGLGCFGYSHKINMGKDMDMLKVNIIAPTALTKLFSRDMVEEGEGYILNISSLGAFMPGPFIASYYASKSFILSYSEAISVELKKYNIKVSALCVGPVDTDFQNKAEISKNKSLKLFCKSPKNVAKKSYIGMKKGKTIILPGISDKTLPFMIRFMPRKLIRRIASLSQNKCF